MLEKKLLLELKIQNYLLIENLQISFCKGLNIFTGETGSGKSIILEAIQGLISNRLNSDLIRMGSKISYLEGVFEIDENIKAWLKELDGLELSDNVLIISREITEKGSRARINGVLVTAKLVQELGSKLIEIHGQSSEQEIMQPKKQIGFLDSYLGKEHLEIYNSFKSQYSLWRQIQAKIEEEQKSLYERNKELDYLKFQIEELESLSLQDPLEEEKLKDNIDKFSQADSSKEVIEEIEYLFFETDNNISSAFGGCLRKLNDCAKNDTNLKEINNNLQDLYSQMSELVQDLRSYELSLDQEIDIDALNVRLNALQKLRRKHNCASLAELIQTEKNLSKRIEYLENISQNLQSLELDLQKKENNLKKTAQILSTNRIKAAIELSEKVTKNLFGLGMATAEFKINCQNLETLNSDGMNKIEFLFKANAGDILRPLNKVASGGELSRIMLLLKTLIGSDHFILLFDEIDAGTSGKVSRLIAEKLSHLAKKQQVLCVTHQPLVAAYADAHFMVSKQHSENKTHLILNILTSQEEKIIALVDLMAGERDKILAKEYAKELIVKAQNRKNEELQNTF